MSRVRGVVYCFTNSINGKRYIGKTLDETKRFSHHVYKSRSSNRHLYRAMRKYGLDNFEYLRLFIMLGDDRRDVDAIIKEMEMYFISFYKTNECGYNMTLGGDGQLGYKRPPDVVEKIAQKLRGQKRTDEYRQRMSVLLTGRKLSPDAIRKGVEKRRGQKRSEETKKKMSAALLGKKRSEAFKEQCRLRATGRHPSEETIAKMRKVKLGVKKSEGMREKMRNRPVKDETREKLRRANVGKKLGEETKAKISASRRGKKWPPGQLEKVRETRRLKKLKQEDGRVAN